VSHYRPDLVNIKGLVENRTRSAAPSNLAVAGRYILTPAVFDLIRQQPRGAGGEIQLTDGIAALLQPNRCWPIATTASVTTVAANSA
jgi:UTP-glucose-1-phosphate uridylyltransferase